jgi:hypothetical protein
MKLFYSYSHKDEEYRRSLEKFLVNLRQEFLINEWYDRKILVGDDWSKEIENNMETSDVILLLISQDYLVSSACNHELEYAIEHKDSKTIIPIVLKPCTWKDTRLGSIQALPLDGKPVDAWNKPNEAWLDVYDGIKKVIQRKREVGPKQEFMDSLEPISFVSSRKNNVKLSDVFVWPEFYVCRTNASEDNVDGSSDVFINPRQSYSLIKGIELSGKSSIARTCFVELYIKNFFPLLFDGDIIYKTRDFDSMLEQTFANQYHGSIDDYKKNNNKVILIDNYQHKISNNTIKWAKQSFDYIILFTDNEEYMLYYKDDKDLADFNVFTICNFNSSLQYELIKKWKILCSEGVYAPEYLEMSIDDLELKVNSIIKGNSIVPRYPFYILSVLQTFEGFLPSDYQITAYGHCYTALITSQLIKKGISPNDIEDCYNYLTYISYRMYKEQKDGSEYISRDIYVAIKSEYKKQFLIKENLISRIEDSEYPIIRVEGTVTFEYPYIYYFFCGKYIAEKCDEKEIESLCDTIYRKESANILIFSIHHTTNTVLLDEIELHCMVLFDNIAPAKLSAEETSFMDSLLLEMPKQILNNKATEENRIQERKNKDLEEAEEYDTDDRNIDPQDINTKVLKAFKIIEVLGQIVKNRAGSFEKKHVLELLDQVEQLGFRILNFFLGSLRDPEFSEWLMARLETIENEKTFQGKKISKKEKAEFIEKSVQIMGLILILSMLSKIFYATCTEKVLEVQEEIAKNNRYPSIEFIDLMFHISYEELKADRIKALYKRFSDEKNIWALKTLSIITQNHLNTHSVDFQERQKICKILGIEYVPNKSNL